MLCLSQFTKSYGALTVLKIDQLQFEPGIHWIRGENGSGKTTLFKSLSGLLPCEGSVTLGDIDLHRQPVDYRRRVNYSEAEPLYPGFLTAKDLVRFVGKAKGADIPQQSELVSRFGVIRYFEHPCETFSSGMIKKLSLVLAFLGQPDVVILDEPLITLDEAARKVLFAIVDERLREKPMIFLVSSHQPFEAGALRINHEYVVSNQTVTRL
ncbi:MAG: ABC transporter ATP-binding protein [Bacteroidia bacterium]|nr:ABC transporter ATP-binding protein [Bacteroidia bacterium]